MPPAGRARPDREVAYLDRGLVDTHSGPAPAAPGPREGGSGVTWQWWLLGYAVVGWVMVEFCIWGHRRLRKPLPRDTAIWVFLLWPIALAGALLRVLL